MEDGDHNICRRLLGNLNCDSAGVARNAKLAVSCRQCCDQRALGHFDDLRGDAGNKSVLIESTTLSLGG